jgi:hypothetical protein
MITNLELFKHVIYYMLGNMPELEMEDFKIMWQALAHKWEIYIPEEKWNDFLQQINNSEVYQNYINFTEIFNNYFYN